MIRPLKKRDQNGNLYTRPPETEQAIAAAILQDLATLRRRAAVSTRSSPDFLPSECLVYLIREAWRRRDEQTMNDLMAPLLTRSEALLEAKVPDGLLPNAAEIRENILSEFSFLFVRDGSGDDPDELDFFECRFNQAFRAFRIDFVRREVMRTKHLASLPAENDEASHCSSDEDVFSHLSEAFRNPPTQLQKLFRKDLLEAINSLPPDERKAVVLCHVLGSKEEAEDPSETTAATLCGVTGRTIRNRLNRAAARLSKFKGGIR